MILIKGVTGEHKYTPWANIDLEGPPLFSKTNEIQSIPDLSYASGWPSGPGGKRYAIPSIIRGGVAAYKTFPSPLPVFYNESVLTPTAKREWSACNKLLTSHVIRLQQMDRL